jgi:hypothetical protein
VRVGRKSAVAGAAAAGAVVAAGAGARRLSAFDHNRHGTAYALTTFAPILPGHEQAVREHIESLPKGTASPLARLEQLHFSRLHIFDELVYQGAPQKPDTLKSAYLVFTGSFDGELDRFLDDLCTKVGADADAWWSHCVAYPGTADREAFGRWIRHNQIPTGLYASAYPNESVADVREALALRRRVLDFAIDAQGLDAPELKSRFDAAFGEAG